jgi:ketosteroid isomerase-like protein
MKRFIGLILLCAFVSLAVAQDAKEKSALESMVDTERAFARMSEEAGVRPSFMAFIADDGILFRPTAVKGKQWMIDHPLPASDKRPLLRWWPTFADIASAGDMGYTTGPWEFKENIQDEKPVAFGNFLTVWRKQPDGSWRFAIDLGISNPQPAQSPGPWQLPVNYKAPKPLKGSWSFSSTPILERDREFSKSSAKNGAQKAFDAYAADDVRVFRNDNQPFIGKKLALTALPESPVIWTWEPAFADVSHSDDLGYSYGTYQLTKDGSKIESGNYYRIWRKRGKVWQVVSDLLNPVPEPKKS